MKSLVLPVKVIDAINYDLFSQHKSIYFIQPKLYKYIHFLGINI